MTSLERATVFMNAGVIRDEIDELLRTVGLKDFSEMLVEHELDNFLPTNGYRYCNFLCCDFFVVLYWLAIELSLSFSTNNSSTSYLPNLEMNELKLGRLTLFSRQKR